MSEPTPTTETNLNSHKHLLAKTPRTVLYGIGIAAAVVIVLAVISEVLSPGSVQRSPRRRIPS